MDDYVALLVVVMVVYVIYKYCQKGNVMVEEYKVNQLSSMFPHISRAEVLRILELNGGSVERSVESLLIFRAARGDNVHVSRSAFGDNGVGDTCTERYFKKNGFLNGIQNVDENKIENAEYLKEKIAQKAWLEDSKQREYSMLLKKKKVYEEAKRKYMERCSKNAL